MSEYDKEPLSRAEEILDETSSGTEYDKEPLSRVEFRLKEVMAKIDGLVPDATVYKPAGSVTFANLPTPSKSTLGYVYDVSDAFTTTSDFKEGSGKKYPAGTNVAIVDIGTDENPIYKYDVLSGFIDMDNYVKKEAGKGLSSNDFTNEAKNKLDGLENYDDTEIKNDISDLSDAVADKVDKVNGKGLSTNDYTDADKALVQDSPITVTATASPISTANGKPRAITIYGKSEVVDGAIKSAGEGWSVVRLADLSWEWWNAHPNILYTNIIDKALGLVSMLCSDYPYRQDLSFSFANEGGYPNKTIYCSINTNAIYIKNTDYNTKEDFVASLGDATLCYKLADPSQGNCIAVKTDDGTGIDGTMAVFSTGTPLYGVSDTIRDVIQWNGSAGEVTKNCAKVRLADLTWDYTDIYGNNTIGFRALAPANLYIDSSISSYPTAISSIYTPISANAQSNYKTDKSFAFHSGYIKIIDTDYTTVSDFVASLGDAELVYELATPTTEQLTQTENDSLSTLKTYSPQTSITINDSPDFKIEAYANTANGQAISDMQPTRSPLLTLSASGWTNNAQTVTYAHDTSKRNSIDVEPENIKAWTAAGILATAETATSITFECDTTPTSDLSFRITSMEVR